MAIEKVVHHTMERKLVSTKEHEGSEAKAIASNYKIPIKDVKKAMMEVGKNAKPSRSRWRIYKKLREMGYEIKTRYTK